MMNIESRVISYIKTHTTDMFSLLEKMVLIQSGSHNKKGVDRVSNLIKTFFQSNGTSCRVIEQTEFGNHLVVKSLCEEYSEKQILLVGHMDTVFPKDTDFNWYKEDSAKCYGPGVIDMKGGLVAGIFALKTLDSIGLLKKIPITFIFNSDEEIGSPNSRTIIKDEANKSACAFVLENGGLEGEVVTGRKGNLVIKLNVIGKAGHAAFADKNKTSAILELAHKIIEIESLNDFERGITVNAGKIEGGIGPNSVPDRATAFVDLRFYRQSGYPFLKKQIEEIIEKPNIPGTTCDLQIISSRLPMEQNGTNRKLFRTTKEVAESLGFPIKEEFRYGVSDANIIAEQNVPVLDGMGPVGAKDHSKDEYMVKESLSQRSALLAASIIECSERYLKKNGN
ncbi:M20 family metallopeptidase [Thermodesulfobacteriota bacterium]